VVIIVERIEEQRILIDVAGVGPATLDAAIGYGGRTVVVVNLVRGVLP
jgi:hypothetical protein